MMKLVEAYSISVAAIAREHAVGTHPLPIRDRRRDGPETRQRAEVNRATSFAVGAPQRRAGGKTS